MAPSSTTDRSPGVSSCSAVQFCSDYWSVTHAALEGRIERQIGPDVDMDFGGYAKKVRTKIACNIF